MSDKQSNAPLIGVGVAACAICFAGPLLGVLAAVGISTGVGYALFGFGAFAIGATVATLVVLRRRRRAADSARVETLDGADGCNSAAAAAGSAVDTATPPRA